MCCGIGAKCHECLSWFVPIDPDLVRVTHQGHDYHAKCVPGAKHEEKKAKPMDMSTFYLLYPHADPDHYWKTAD